MNVKEKIRKKFENCKMQHDGCLKLKVHQNLLMSNQEQMSQNVFKKLTHYITSQICRKTQTTGERCMESQ